MSESVSTGAAPAAATAPATTSGTTTPTNAGATSGSPGTPPPAQATPSQGTQERVLAETDLDAFVEQTINGKKERIKVRDALKGYGLEKTANQRLQEAAQIKKQAQQLVQLFQTDPDKFFEITRVDKNQWLKAQVGKHLPIAEEILASEYERQQMSPEARELLEAKQKLAEYEGRIAKQREPMIAEIKKLVPENRLPKGLESATPEQLHQYLQVKRQEFQQGVDNLSTELLGAWQKQGLPRQKFMGQLMAMEMSDHQKRTGGPLQAEAAAVKVKTRVLGAVSEMLSQMDAKAIHETLGDQVVEKLREYLVEQVRSSAPQFGKVDGPANAASSETPKKTMNQFEFRQWAGMK